jgi:hypothetical protein
VVRVTFVVRDRASLVVLVLATALLELAILPSPRSAAANAGTEQSEQVTKAVAGLTLCYFYDGKRSRGCQLRPAVNSPTAVVQLLRATWRWRFGDIVEVFERQTVPAVHPRRMLRMCAGTPPCFVSAHAPPPRYGGIVAADYVAFLFRGGRQVGESNVIQLDWVT